MSGSDVTEDIEEELDTEPHRDISPEQDNFPTREMSPEQDLSPERDMSSVGIRNVSKIDDTFPTQKQLGILDEETPKEKPSISQLKKV